MYKIIEISTGAVYGVRNDLTKATGEAEELNLGLQTPQYHVVLA